jgi:hypothetical protein
VDARGGSSHTASLGDRGWYIETIWQAALGVPVTEVPIDTIREIDEDCWFQGQPVTVRAVIDHARRIEGADLSMPIILASDGQVLDGMHRIAKAVLIGRTSVTAQRLAADPNPDWLRPDRPSQ